MTNTWHDSDGDDDDVIATLAKVGNWLDLWRAFCAGQVYAKLREISHTMSISRQDEYDTLYVRFSQPEEHVRAVIAECARGVPNYTFLRHALYNPEARAEVPLSLFLASAEGTQPQPTLTLHVNKPMTIRSKCFSLVHRIKDDGRIGILSVSHPFLFCRPRHRGDKADEPLEVSRKMFPRNATRPEMFESMLADVREKQESGMFTLVDSANVRDDVQALRIEGELFNQLQEEKQCNLEANLTFG